MVGTASIACERIRTVCRGGLDAFSERTRFSQFRLKSGFANETRNLRATRQRMKAK